MLIAQIALGVIVGGLTLSLLVTSFILWVQSQQGRSETKRPFAVGLFIAAAVIVMVLVAVVVVG
jgi:quinol-cytochrome oxidoreductase complex cytochrome b subunit